MGFDLVVHSGPVSDHGRFVPPGAGVRAGRRPPGGHPEATRTAAAGRRHRPAPLSELIGGTGNDWDEFMDD